MINTNLMIIALFFILLSPLLSAACNDPPAAFVDWSDCQNLPQYLAYANLQYANLKNANLQGADLHSAQLAFAKLDHANLRWANLKKANFESASLRYADLRNVQAQNTIFTDTDLSWANLKDSQLDNAILQQTHLQGANQYQAKREKLRYYLPTVIKKTKLILTERKKQRIAAEKKQRYQKEQRIKLLTKQAEEIKQAQQTITKLQGNALDKATDTQHIIEENQKQMQALKNDFLQQKYQQLSDIDKHLLRIMQKYNRNQQELFQHDKLVNKTPYPPCFQLPDLQIDIFAHIFEYPSLYPFYGKAIKHWDKKQFKFMKKWSRYCLNLLEKQLNYYHKKLEKRYPDSAEKLDEKETSKQINTATKNKKKATIKQNLPPHPLLQYQKQQHQRLLLGLNAAKKAFLRSKQRDNTDDKVFHTKSGLSFTCQQLRYFEYQKHYLNDVPVIFGKPIDTLWESDFDFIQNKIDLCLQKRALYQSNKNKREIYEAQISRLKSLKALSKELLDEREKQRIKQQEKQYQDTLLNKAAQKKAKRFIVLFSISPSQKACIDAIRQAWSQTPSLLPETHSITLKNIAHYSFGKITLLSGNATATLTLTQEKKSYLFICHVLQSKKLGAVLIEPEI